MAFDPNDPKHTVEVLEHLIATYGFVQQHFRQLHHFPKASLVTHINYCRRLAKDFTSSTNVAVAKRLHRLLGYLRSGQEIDPAVERVSRELPLSRP